MIFFLEDYSPTFHYIAVPHNVVADNFSRLPRMSDHNGNNKRKLLSEYLEDLDKDSPDGQAGIALFLYHCDQRVTHNEEGKIEESTFFNIKSFYSF